MEVAAAKAKETEAARYTTTVTTTIATTTLSTTSEIATELAAAAVIVATLADAEQLKHWMLQQQRHQQGGMRPRKRPTVAAELLWKSLTEGGKIMLLELKAPGRQPRESMRAM